MVAILGRTVALLLIFGVALYAVLGYLLMPMGALVHPQVRSAFIGNSQAIYVPLSVVAGLEFGKAYPIIAWLCWVPNLALAEWRFVRR